MRVECTVHTHRNARGPAFTRNHPRDIDAFLIYISCDRIIYDSRFAVFTSPLIALCLDVLNAAICGPKYVVSFRIVRAVEVQV